LLGRFDGRVIELALRLAVITATGRRDRQDEDAEKGIHVLPPKRELRTVYTAFGSFPVMARTNVPSFLSVRYSAEGAGRACG
jgi:hypothetical protein